MAILVLYATKSGASEQCAHLLSQELSHCTICNIDLEKPNIAEFDSIILGAGVRDGKIYKAIRDFIKKNKDALLHKNMGYFICNEKPKKTEEIIADNIPEDLQKAAICIESFGGYKAYAAPKEGSDQLKGIFVDRIKTFSEKFK
ncbi:flavodoxin domain-containing protein [Paenibacillus macquariensis]|uniref:Menaquinone-dependent protoporphyrinogen oxidase n=1 Tax=Paenibacillus macquariensis TaxID=948756 RepID=A0ABY1JMZ3_9BACL|nr:flavodoxin domain-containing protein [Paenibacillus macquariensis]MEC0092253.1 flavodoxin domain-containing protein [Paenibacillus macquariensis]OAB37201.1 flavodoxin [Paenibacillus macquariensis subsp. macquariensis]SIQ47790.1 menaquinone-dependent protoporphyrinogen oxidase [Paenibacillus macquariensis]